MGRKSNGKDLVLPPPEIINTNDDDSNNRYRKRLRSWKQPSAQLKSHHSFDSPSHTDDNEISDRKSTMYTYPINFNNDRQSTSSTTVFSESLTTESELCCPSSSCHSIRTVDDLNNNHITTLDVEEKKRQNCTSSCESFSNQISQIKTLDILPNPNQLSNNNLQLTYRKSPTKRSHLSIEDSIITNHRLINSPLLIDECTIDINQLDQQKSLSYSTNNEFRINNSNSIETAMKMIQPIVDIIFNAFERQLRSAQTKSNQSLSPLTPVMIPYFPLTSSVPSITLNAVNFNIQLATKQQTMSSIERPTISEQYLINKNHDSRSVLLTEFKQKVISLDLITEYGTHGEVQRRKKRHQLKRIIQLVVFGVSVLCGYLLL